MANAVVKKSKLLRSGMITSFFTLLSRILGMFRDIVIASTLGAGMSADIFFFANRIPNFFRRLFAEGAFAQSFVPVMSKVKEQGSHQDLRLMLAHTSGTLGVCVLAVTLIGMFASPILTALFGWGWFQAHLNGEIDGDKFIKASELLKITFPYLFFITLTALTSSILNVFGRFAIPAMTPCILNLTLIAFVLCLTPYFDDANIVLAYGMVIGGVLQLLFQIPLIIKLKLLVMPKWGWSDPNVKKIRTLMLPAILGVSASQLNLLVNTVLASFLATGAISYLYYSDRLLEFPIGIFAVAISTVILPALSKVNQASDPSRYQKTLDWGVRLVLLLGLPSMFGIIALREPMLRVIFMRGAFNIEHVSLSAASLMASVSGLAAIMLVRVLVQGFAAIQDTKTPVRCSLCAIASNIIFNLILIAPLGYVGLALSTALAAYLNAGLLLFFLYKRKIYTLSTQSLLFIVKASIASIIMAIVVRYLSFDLETWAQMSTLNGALYLAAFIALGAIIFIGICLITGIKPKTLKM
ncbi:MAG: murein biosynthesis integral membrane protein MurJ [Succinatimonas sp.]|nr:murein biosynthesis integral membrane protein MurJ [Succinatimonas sp.]